MTVKVETETADRLVVVYAPNPDTGEDMYLWAAMNEWLWRTFGIPLDSESVEIHLVYGPVAAGEHVAEGRGAQPALPYGP